MAVTNLTNTVWLINDDLSTASYLDYYSIDFTADGGEYTEIQYDNDTQELQYEGAVVYYQQWYFQADRTITITGGADVEDTDLINWLETNAVQQSSAVTYKHILKDGSKVQVDSAIRDGEGVKIDTNYAKKTEIPTTASQVGAVAEKPDGTHDLISSNKISTTYLPDYLLGQMLYGGSVTGAGVATLSTNAQSKLGTSSASITLTNDTTAITGYQANEGIYYVVSSAGTFASLSLAVGDWLISTGSAWQKIDNTDAVTSVNGQTGAVTLTASNVSALPSSTKYGASLSVSGTSVQLKDQDGNNLGSAITTQDTTYSLATTSANGLMPALESSSVSTQTQSTKFLREDGTWQAPSYSKNITITTTAGSQSVSDGTNTLNFGSNAFNSTTIPSTTSSVTQDSTSALTSGGAYTALSGKLDKDTTTTTYPQIYAKLGNGTQIMENYVSTNQVNNTIMLRNASGQTYVGTPSESHHAVNKDYVDTNFAKKDASNITASTWKSKLGVGETILEDASINSGTYTISNLNLTKGCYDIELRWSGSAADSYMRINGISSNVYRYQGWMNSGTTNQTNGTYTNSHWQIGSRYADNCFFKIRLYVFGYGPIHMMSSMFGSGNSSVYNRQFFGTINSTINTITSITFENAGDGNITITKLY